MQWQENTAFALACDDFDRQDNAADDRTVGGSICVETAPVKKAYLGTDQKSKAYIYPKGGVTVFAVVSYSE